jgi:hypothetical protein
MGRLRRFLGARDRGPGDLITGTVSSRAGDWEVSRAGDGALPASLRAGSLSHAAERAASAVAGLSASLPPNPGAELQLAMPSWSDKPATVHIRVI